MADSRPVIGDNIKRALVVVKGVDVLPSQTLQQDPAAGVLSGQGRDASVARVQNHTAWRDGKPNVAREAVSGSLER